TGIWQTVWLEAVSNTYIADYQAFSDIDKGVVRVSCEIAGTLPCDGIEVEALEKGRVVASGQARPNETVELRIPDPVLWSPAHPHLYALRIRLLRQGIQADEVSGYFGMRKVSLGKDDKGLTRVLVNNQFVFQNGPLDQGFWPDGIYTPPTETAMRYDLEMIRKMGFNMLRKHVKVEPRRFYYWCDRMGLLVWQDMPNGDAKIAPEDPDISRTQESARQFEQELTRLVKTHINHPSIVMWVPFNEGWGQNETPRIVSYVKSLDPSRLVNNASGWSDRRTGDVLDWHSYPAPSCPPAEFTEHNGPVLFCGR
ncbi:MAG: glycoside hydrolase family 2 protein, partial [Bacteroidota bacterium]